MFGWDLKETLSRAKWLVNIGRKIDGFKAWERASFNSPAPHFVKHAVLSRFKADIWIETGTYLGDTTHFLSTQSKHVFTIEPDEVLFKRANRRLMELDNVTVNLGTSQSILPRLLDSILENYPTSSINFYLDGHYSGEGTFWSKEGTPIMEELKIILSHASKLRDFVICIDDFREFSNIDSHSINLKSGYPSRKALLKVASEHQLNWDVTQDIFILWPSRDLKVSTEASI